MGSLRNPVGPLPSSIYWRRRAVGLSLLALVVVLVLWITLSGGGDDDRNGRGGGAPSPAASITPGPSSSGPVVPGEPGGRDTGGNGATGGGSTDTGGTDPGTGGTDGADSAGGDSGGADGAGGAAGTGGTGGTGTGIGGAGAGTGGGSGTGGAGQQVPADSPLPNCLPGSVELTIRAIKVQVPVDEKPKFELVAKNTTAADCKMDFGPQEATVDIKNAANETVWSSKDCPRGARSLLLRVPARTTVTHALEWDRTRSDAQKCDGPAGPEVAPGTYLVELAGAKTPASISLAKD
ncbi:hypothetical protein ACIQM4_09305 [Streptomyces sp. NPDC091272]|uniref:hypothetical protein n=1 Tax=Streptomyces sp. NPDC091272 TaxID=3365981 RepID=UPI003816C38B